MRAVVIRLSNTTVAAEPLAPIRAGIASLSCSLSTRNPSLGIDATARRQCNLAAVVEARRAHTEDAFRRPSSRRPEVAARAPRRPRQEHRHTLTEITLPIPYE